MAEPYPYKSCNNFDTNSKELEALKLRLDYTWKWFSYHAGQRTTLFNYSLIVTGIFANGYVLAIKDGMTDVAKYIAWLGVLMCLVFVMLDRRNKRLVNVGEDLLQELEKKQLFCKGTPENIQGVDEEGLVNRVRVTDETLGTISSTLSGLWAWVKELPKYGMLGRHGVLLPVVELVFGAAFFLGALYAPALEPRAKPSTSIVELKLAPLDEMLRVDIANLNSQTKSLRSQLTEFEESTKNALTRIEAKRKKPPKTKRGR